MREQLYKHFTTARVGILALAVLGASSCELDGLPIDAKDLSNPWPIFYGKAIRKDVSDSGLRGYVDPGIWDFVDSVVKTVRRHVAKASPLGAGVDRCMLLLLLSGPHSRMYFAGVLKDPGKLKGIYEAPYMLWRIAGIRDSRIGVSADIHGRIIDPRAEVGDYFFWRGFTLRPPDWKRVMGCIGSKSPDETVIIRFLTVYDSLWSGTSGLRSQKDYVRRAYWEAITMQVMFATFLHLDLHQGRLPANSSELTQTVGPRIADHWNPVVDAYVDYLLARFREAETRL
jgi:hypothetical protein